MAFERYRPPPRKPKQMMPTAVQFMLCVMIGWLWGLMLQHANDPIPAAQGKQQSKPVEIKKEENGLQMLIHGKVKMPTKTEKPSP